MRLTAVALGTTSRPDSSPPGANLRMTIITVGRALLVACGIALYGVSVAKLPQPAPMDAKAQASAAEKKAADAKKEAAEVAQAQDRAVAKYHAYEASKAKLMAAPESAKAGAKQR